MALTKKEIQRLEKELKSISKRIDELSNEIQKKKSNEDYEERIYLSIAGLSRAARIQSN